MAAIGTSRRPEARAARAATAQIPVAAWVRRKGIGLMPGNIGRVFTGAPRGLAAITVLTAGRERVRKLRIGGAISAGAGRHEAAAFSLPGRRKGAR